MVSKQWAGTLSALTIILAVLCVAAPAMAATWVVNPDGTGNFTTIQAAVDSNWTSGDTIQIEYAVYQESVYVDAEGMNLTITGVLSSGGKKPVIDGMNISGTDSMDGAIASSVLYEAFDGVSFDRGYYDYSLGLINGNFVVSNLYLTNSSGHGLFARPGAEGQTLYATGIEAVDNREVGIWALPDYGTSTIEFSEITLTDIWAYEDGSSGICVYGDSAVFEDIVSTGNGGDGIFIIGDSAVLDGVECTGNSGYGIPIVGDSAVLEDIVSTGNGGDGIYVDGDSAVLGDVVSTGNGGDGIYLYGNSAVLDGVECTENGWDGIGIYISDLGLIVADSEIVSGDSDITLTNILVADNGCDGLWMFDWNVWNNGFPIDISPVDESDDYMVNISRVESTGNSARGIYLEYIYDFSASDLFLAENGYETFSSMSISSEAPVREGASVFDKDIGYKGGNGLLVVNSGYGLIEDVESINNSVTGVYLDNMEGITLRSVEANNNDENGILILNSYYLRIEDVTADGNGMVMGSILSVDDARMDEGLASYGNGICVSHTKEGIIVSAEASKNYNAGIQLQDTDFVIIGLADVSENWYGINEILTGFTIVDDSYAYNNFVDYRYERTGMEIMPVGESIDSFPTSVSSASTSVMDLSGMEFIDTGAFDGNAPVNISLILGLQVSDPADETIMPSVVSFYSNSTTLWVGQLGVNDLNPPVRYHDAGLMYIQVWGDAGSFVYHEFQITPEFPLVTAESLSAWGTVIEPVAWQPVADSHNYNYGNDRSVGGLYIFAEEMTLVSNDGVQASVVPEGWGVSGMDSAMDGEMYGYPSGPVSLLAPFWYEESGGDDAGSGVIGNSTSGIGSSGDQQTGITGVDGIGSVSGEGATPTPTAAPTAESDDENDGGNVTPTMTSGPVGESASPTVPVTQMPVDGGASGSGGFLPWVVLIVVVVAIAGGVYYMKYQQK